MPAEALQEALVQSPSPNAKPDPNLNSSSSNLSIPASPQPKAPPQLGSKDLRSFSRAANEGEDDDDAVAGRTRPFSSSDSLSPSCFRCGSRLHSVAKCPITTNRRCVACQSRHSCRVVSSRAKLMKALNDSGKFSQIEALFDSITRDGHVPSLESCMCMLTGLCKQNRCKKAEKRLRDMVNDGFPLHALCYNTVINGYCEQASMDGAITVFQFMKDNGYKPTRSTFNTLIKGYGMAGNPHKAMELFMHDMINQDDSELKPDVRTYNMLLHAWCINDNLEEAWNLMSTMSEHGIKPNVVTFNTMANAFAEKGMTSKAEGMIREMQSLQLHPNQRTFGIVVNGLCGEGDVERAFALVERMTSLGLRPNVVILNTLMKGYAKSLMLNGIDQVLALMDSSGLKPSLQTYSIMMDAWCSAGLVSKANADFQRMLMAGIPPDVTVFGILVKGYVRARQPQEAECLIQQMQDHSLTPNVVIYTTIISGWCNAGKMDDALRIYDEMIKQKVLPNLRTFETLIWGFSEAKLPSRAEDVLQLMEEQKISPSKKVIEMIANAWRGVGLEGEATRFLSSPKASFNHIQNMKPSEPISFGTEIPIETTFFPSSQFSSGASSIPLDHHVSKAGVQVCHRIDTMQIRSGMWRVNSSGKKYISFFATCGIACCNHVKVLDKSSCTATGLQSLPYSYCSCC